MSDPFDDHKNNSHKNQNEGSENFHFDRRDSHLSWQEIEKELVAEQPGLGLSFIGLFLALFVGIVVRSIVSPERVTELLQKASTQIHKDVSVKFDRAYVSLSDGIWPDLSVMVENLQMQAEPKCWLRPTLEVHEMRLPISLSDLIRGKILIHEVQADEVDLSLRSEYEACSEVAQDAAVENSRLPADVGTAPMVKKEFNKDLHKSEESVQLGVGKAFEVVSRRNPIDTISIRKLRVHYLPIAFSSVEINDFNLQLRSEAPRVALVTGVLKMSGDTLVGDYNSTASWKMQIFEQKPFPSVEVSAHGVWREGHYDFFANLDAKKQSLKSELNLKHIPISQVLPILKKYHLLQSDLNGRSMWASGKLLVAGPVADLQKGQGISLVDLKLEGDPGEISTHAVTIRSLQPLRYDPIDLEIRGLNLKEVLVFLNRQHPSPTFGELGIFNGNAHFVSPDNLTLRGDYSGLEFIFSNQGLRQSQKLSLVSGELKLRGDSWNIKVDRLRPNDGIFDGSVNITADKNFENLDISTRFEELTLSPQVQSLMTNGGSLGALRGDLRTQIHPKQDLKIQGHLKMDQVLVEGFRLFKPRLNIQTLDQEIILDFSAADADVLANKASQITWLQPLLSALPVENGIVVLKNPSAKIRTTHLRSLRWQPLQVQTKAGSLRSMGGWDERGFINGDIRMSGAKPQVFNLSGTRDEPVLRKK